MRIEHGMQAQMAIKAASRKQSDVNAFHHALNQEKRMFNSANDGKVVKKETEVERRAPVPEYDSENFDI